MAPRLFNFNNEIITGKIYPNVIISRIVFEKRMNMEKTGNKWPTLSRFEKITTLHM